MAEIFKRSDRGFHGYGKEPLKCTYNGTAEVYESSAADGPRVWLKVEDGYPIKASSVEGVAYLHLDKEQVLDLIDRLQTWVDEIPSRWDA